MYNSCNPCGACNPQPDCTDRCLDINYQPGNDCQINYTHMGCTSALDIRPAVACAETDTRLELDRDGCDIRFYSERYYTAGTAPQAINIHDLGGCIALGDLANVSDKANHPDHCSFLVYKKSADCGDGCEGKDDAWQPWSPLNNKADGLHYVMGLNEDGCPITLNDPTGTFGDNKNDQYHFAMWRPNGQFGYTQPEKVTTLPKGENGNSLVLSQDNNGKPIFGPIDFTGMFNESEETYFDPAPGFKIIPNQGNHVIYYKNRQQMTLVLDLGVTTTRNEQSYDKLHIATIHDSRFWPNINDGDFIDLPIHASWNTWSDFNPVALKINNKGQLLLSGRVTARALDGGPKEVMVNGIDDVVAWVWKG